MYYLIKNNIILCLLFVNITFSLSAQLANSPCPKFHINDQNTGLSAYGATPLGSLTSLVKTNWKSVTGFFVVSSPAIGSDGKIYVGSYDGYLYCFNTNGTTNWKSAGAGGLLLPQP